MTEVPCGEQGLGTLVHFGVRKMRAGRRVTDVCAVGERVSAKAGPDLLFVTKERPPG